MKIQESYEINRYAADMIEELVEKTGHYHKDYVFEVLYKRDFETDFTKSYELGEYLGNKDDWELYWYGDWWIGQNEVIFSKLVPLDDILNCYFEAREFYKKE